MPALTVIIPSYNRASLLTKTLASFVAQSNKDYSLILIDHNSTDETQQVVQAYQHLIPLQYYWLSRDGFTPGTARAYGVQQAHSPLIAFLDAGNVVPSFYVAAHLQFHAQGSHRLGIGWQHGLLTNPDDPRWSSIVPENIDEGDHVFSQYPDFCDERKGLHLETLDLPWLLVWSGNMSIRLDDYQVVRGFDTEHQGWGFEDIDLGYRLFRKGIPLAFVEDGWVIHLPHPRTPARYDTQQQNILRSYRKQRTLGSEVVAYTTVKGIMDRDDAENAFKYLMMLGSECAKMPSLPATEVHHIPHPRLLIGGTSQQAQIYDFVTVANENVPVTPTVWSCSGILIPLPDHSLASVVVSDIWKWLGCSFNQEHVSLLESMISEIKRTSQKAFFVDSTLREVRMREQTATLTDLTNMCLKYDLAFEIIHQE